MICTHCGLEIKKIPSGLYWVAKIGGPDGRDAHREYYGLCPGPLIAQYPRYKDWDIAGKGASGYTHKPMNPLRQLVKEVNE